MTEPQGGQTATGAPSSSSDKTPLDELMLAMDVVDTLRHRELVVERELNTEDRERALIDRLREIYAAQGIEVTDRILAEGVQALREDRFTYQPPTAGVAISLAKVYINRGRVTKILLAVVGTVALIWGGYQLLIKGPAERRLAAIPEALGSHYQAVIDVTDVADIEALAKHIADDGRAALESGHPEQAQRAVDQLENLRARLEQSYELRIVSRPDEYSGVWRIPERNPNARNYYLIVEAVTPEGEVLTLPVTNEEDGRVERVSKFGLRVDEQVFNRVAADKQDDGIVQNRRVGVKRRGQLEPEYDISTTGATIVAW